METIRITSGGKIVQYNIVERGVDGKIYNPRTNLGRVTFKSDDSTQEYIDLCKSALYTIYAYYEYEGVILQSSSRILMLL